MINKQKAAIMFDSELYNSRFDPTWNRHVLYSLAEWINGMAFRNINFTSNGKPVIKIAEIKNGISGQTKFTQRDYDSIYHVTDGDMLFSWSGQPDISIDVFRWRGPDGGLNQHIFKVHPKDQCLEAYFFYPLKYLNPNFVRIALNKQTTGLGHVTKRDLQNMKVGLPSEDKQRAIAHILGSLDDKIELNRQMNRTLEAMTQAIFKSWFVDFDPVRAKAEGHDSGLPKDIADLFPDSFEDSELGEIPKGWEVKEIKKCCKKVQNGGTPKRSEPDYWNPGTVPWLTSGEVRQTLITTTENMISEIGLKKSSAKWLPEDSTVVALYGATSGQVALVSSKMTTNQAVCGLIPKASFRYFNYPSLDRSVGILANLARGSAQQNISKGIVETTKVIIPRADILESFDQVVSPVFDKWIANLEKSKTLISLRDALLPKLISGKLHIPDAEEFVEEARV
jgi:type I restriction enzyme, S subunit